MLAFGCKLCLEGNSEKPWVAGIKQSLSVPILPRAAALGEARETSAAGGVTMEGGDMVEFCTQYVQGMVAMGSLAQPRGANILGENSWLPPPASL